MPKTSELPDVDAETLNAMIRDIAREIGCPYWAHPDLVHLDHIPGYVYGGNLGCARTMLDEYLEGQEWRRRAIAALKGRPDWVRGWLADSEMDRRVKELCAARGLTFMPYECPPWVVGVDEELPPLNEGSRGWDASKRLAQRLRRQLEAELRARAPVP